MGEFWRRLGILLRSRSVERDLDEELRFHLEMKTRQTGDRAVARRAVGSALRWRERARDAWGWRWFDDVVWDVRYALRQFRRNPAFTAVAVTMLALGIGINTAVFTLANTVLFKGFPFIDRNDRVLYIHTPNPMHPDAPEGYSSYADFQDWRALAKSFDGMAFVSGSLITLSDGRGFPENYAGSQVSASTFHVLRQTPLIGRDFAPADERPGADPVVIVSYQLWTQRFGKDPALVGRTVRLNGVQTTVIGVMAEGFSFPYNEVLWMPATVTAEFQQRQARRLWLVFGRLSEGATLASARAELETIGQALAEAYPQTNHGVRPVVQSYNEFWVGSRATMIYTCLLGAVGCVLLIACANVANLLLARAMVRSREISVRMALGAGRSRIVRQLLIENVMLSTMGGGLGWWLARWGVGAPIYKLAAFTTFGTPAWFDFTMDFRVLGYLVAVSMATGLLFGLAPALRLSKLDLNGALKDGGHGAAGGSRHARLSALLVVGEMALAMVLLGGAGVMMRSFLHIYSADIGAGMEHILTASMRLPVDRYRDAESWVAFFDRATARTKMIPGVESVTLASALPTLFSFKLPFELNGAPPGDEQHRPTLSALVVGSGYFHTLGATLLSGRDFADTDASSSAPVAIVNTRFANMWWPGQDPRGKRLRVFNGTTPDAWRTVVGVVSNIVQDDRTRQTFEPLVYMPYRQRPAAGMIVIARASIPPANLGMTLRRELQTLDSDLPIGGPFTLAEAIGPWNYGLNGSMAVLFGLLAMVALLLASIGLYAVIAHMVSQRTQEIGIRVAIGATARDILRLVYVQGMVPLGIGLTIGVCSSLAINRVLSSALVQVSPTDPLTLVVSSVTLLVFGTLGCWLPARRAIRVDPLLALRHQ